MDTFDPSAPASAPPEGLNGPSTQRVWAVGALVRAVADALASRFNPVAVQGEIAGFSRATSGHCYFSLKDESGQLRCAMFRRVADQLDFAPREGMRVQLRARLDVYGPRGDLQLIVEGMKPAGQGSLYEQFLRLKAELQAEGLFDAERKRALPAQPRHLGVVTSLGAAALRDVVTALRRRVPHLPVTVFPCAVQGTQAPPEIVDALVQAQAFDGARGRCDLILLVRGGGSLEDLWSFNDAAVVRAVAHCRVPVIVGVGHETDFTLADFAADLRAPTPTAAAELCAPAQVQRLAEVDRLDERWRRGWQGSLDGLAQRLDSLVARLGRPSARVARAAERLTQLHSHLQGQTRLNLQRQTLRQNELAARLPAAGARALVVQRERLRRAQVALQALDPQLVLQRGYAYLTDAAGQAVTHAGGLQAGQALTATLVDGRVPLVVGDRSAGAA